MTATEIREALQGARTMLEDENNIVFQAQHFFEDKDGAAISVGDVRDFKMVDRVCGAGAFMYAAKTPYAIGLEDAFTFRNFGSAEGVVSYMTKLVSMHDYGALLDLYDEAIAYWSACEVGIAPIQTTAHERSLIA